MNYTKDDFKNCVGNPLLLTFNRSGKFNKVIEILDEDTDKPHLSEDICKFIVFCYDPKSPLIIDYQEHRARKIAAADLLKIVDADDLIDLTRDSYIVAIHYFLRHYIKNMDWAVIQANTETFWEYQMRLMKPITKDQNAKEKDVITAIQVKSKLAEDLSVISKRIQEHTKSFYNEDDALIKGEERLRYSSEAIANVFQAT